ncbi:MAG: hypothetical protein NVS3B12_13100 [Acidimicrobiales bacterium]
MLSPPLLIFCHVTQNQELRETHPLACTWCRTPIVQAGRGRPRRYCKASCRQRAYEHRCVVKAAAAVEKWLDWTRWRLEDVEAKYVKVLGTGRRDPAAVLGGFNGKRRFPPLQPLPVYPRANDVLIPARMRVSGVRRNSRGGLPEGLFG